MKIAAFYMLHSTDSDNGAICPALFFSGEELTQYTIDQRTKKNADGRTDAEVLTLVGYRVINN